MAANLKRRDLLSIEDVDKAFLSYFADESNVDSSGKAIGLINVGDTTVNVMFYATSPRIKKHAGSLQKSQYPGIYVQSMEPSEDEEMPNPSQPREFLSDDGNTTLIMDPEVWFKFQYQVSVASMDYKESRKLSHKVHNLFPKLYGTRSIQLGDYIRELKITDRSNEDLLEDGIFRSMFTFQFSMPLYQSQGVIFATIQSVDINIKNQLDELLHSETITY